MNEFARSVAGVLILLTMQTAFGGDEIGIKDTDRVVFYGDRTVYPPGFGGIVEHFVRIRYPESKSRFWHAGLKRYATVAQANERFDEIVAPLTPTIVVLALGLGDGELRPADEGRLKSTGDEFERLLARCRTLGSQVYVVTPPCPSVGKKSLFQSIDYDKVIGDIAERMADVAKGKGAGVVDWFHATQPLQPTMGARLTDTDGLHPTVLSNAIAAALLMDAWQFKPLEVTIDVSWTSASASTTMGSANVIKTDDSVQLRLKDIPQPLFTGNRQDAFREELACARFCQIRVRCKDLPDGSYALDLGGSRAKPTMFTADELRDGINLATLRGYQRGVAARHLTSLFEEKHSMFDGMTRYHRKMKDEPAEPELLKSFELSHQSRVEYHEGLVKIIQRTPRTTDAVINVKRMPQASIHPED